jgi:predicted Zn-dependent protease with MMP-like domain
MKFAEFERRAREAFEEIPEHFKEGIDGLEVSRESVPHPTLPDVFTLGQCVTEEHLSEYGSPETTRSAIVLYWGSFQGLAGLDPDFDWDGEIWETLTHELRHHLESLARDDALEEVDYAADELFNRQEGLTFDPWYYQKGDVEGEGVYIVEGYRYLEQTWRAQDFEHAPTIEFTWRDSRYRIPRPSELGDLNFVWIEGPDFVDARLELVLVRKRSWAESLKRLASSSDLVVLESEAVAERVA